MKYFWISSLWMMSFSALTGQSSVSTADFSTTPDGSGVRFNPVLPPLNQVAGAPPAFYTYHWEFGDGDFSNEPAPVHQYANMGTFPAYFCATNNYDDTRKKPPGGVPKLCMANNTGTPAPPRYAFKDDRQAIALKANREAKAGDELILVLSYRNTAKTTTNGQIYLFYNEKIFPTRHFEIMEGRTHFGETRTPNDVSTIADPSENTFAMQHAVVGVDWANEFDPKPIENESLKSARKWYKEECSWQFTNLLPDARRNMFISLRGSKDMVKDTNVLIHIKGIYVPHNSNALPTEFTLELEIVSSHDPNAIGVSDNRVNYRLIGVKDLSYKVKFQNNGEGPAQTIKVAIGIPRGLELNKAKPVDWYPKCPLCPKNETTKSCLEFETKADSVIFTFRNIYLPGSRQKGIMEYDSTKGFVKYRIEGSKAMPKRPFRSKAQIFFDKNPPIYTNFSKTRFKPGFSPGPKIGYGFPLDSIGQGYFFIGISASPYKSWRIYPQAELLLGVRGRTNLPEQSQITVDTLSNSSIDYFKDSTSYITTTGSKGYTTLEIPFLLRKNFHKRLGVGIGGSAILILENGENKTTGEYQIGERKFQNGQVGDKKIIAVGNIGSGESVPYSNRRVQYALFGDLTLGSVRSGPNIGIRAGYRFGTVNAPFVQLSLELKI